MIQVRGHPTANPDVRPGEPFFGVPISLSISGLLI